MRNIFRKRALATVLVLAMVITAMAALCVGAYADYEDDKDLALDVVFVVDYSGSMRYSDPEAVANEACTLFTNMCDPSRARVGAVLFTTEIQYTLPLTELQQEEDKEYVLWWLDTMQYTVSGDTDISLGLTAAKNLLKESGSFNGDRNPMIIFLSDGKTDRISEQRQSVYDEELNQTLNELAENDVEIYTIGLTNSDQIDEAVLQRMADETGGRYYPTQTADNLDAILSEILALQIRSNIIPIGEFDSDGSPVTVSIPIPNDSIYQANVIIMSSKGISDLHLVNPGGTEVVIPSDRVLRVDSRVYTLIKVISPQMGQWELTLTGANEDHITINLLNSYDMALSIQVSQSDVVHGDTVDIQVFMSDLDGAIEDGSLFDNASGTLVVTNEITGESETVELASNGSYMATPYTFGKAGNYRLDAQVDGDGFRKTASMRFAVSPMPLEALTDGEEKTVMTLSPIFGIGVFNHKNIKLNKLFSWDQTTTLMAVPVSGGWEEQCQFEYDEESGTVRLTATRSGQSNITIKVNDDYGQGAQLDIRLIAIPGWLPLLVVLLLAALVVLVVYQQRQKRKPVIGGQLTISATRKGDGPLPEITVDLSALNSKGAVSLDSILGLSGTYGDPYKKLLSGIFDITRTVTFEAMDAKSGKLRVCVTPNKNRSVVVDDAEIEQRTEKMLLSDDRLSLEVDGDYELRFSFKNESGGFDGDGGWNTGAGGFGGGFGGDSFGGAGGFGGGNDGFGGFGGDSFGGAGGFGGGDNFGGGAFGGSLNDNGFGGGSADNGFGGGFGGGNDSFGGFGNGGASGGFSGAADDENGGFGSF